MRLGGLDLRISKRGVNVFSLLITLGCVVIGLAGDLIYEI